MGVGPFYWNSDITPKVSKAASKLTNKRDNNCIISHTPTAAKYMYTPLSCVLLQACEYMNSKSADLIWKECERVIGERDKQA
jgi:hypothetical protein